MGAGRARPHQVEYRHRADGAEHGGAVHLVRRGPQPLRPGGATAWPPPARHRPRLGGRGGGLGAVRAAPSGCLQRGRTSRAAHWRHGWPRAHRVYLAHHSLLLPAGQRRASDLAVARRPRDLARLVRGQRRRVDRGHGFCDLAVQCLRRPAPLRHSSDSPRAQHEPHPADHGPGAADVCRPSDRGSARLTSRGSRRQACLRRGLHRLRRIDDHRRLRLLP